MTGNDSVIKASHTHRLDFQDRFMSPHSMHQPESDRAGHPMAALVRAATPPPFSSVARVAAVVVAAIVVAAFGAGVQSPPPRNVALG